MEMNTKTNREMEMDDKLMRTSLTSWIDQEQIVNEDKRPIDLGRYYFLYDIYEDKNKKIAVKKSAQSGISTWAILRGLHAGRYQGLNQIHTLPTVGDANTFVQSKVNQIIKNNSCLNTKMSKEDTDSVGQKQMGKGFLFYKGTIGKTSGIMITSDSNVYDEYDFSDMDNIGNYESRLEGEASQKMEAWISTPTLPAYGIDEKFEESDQKHMRFNCPKCGLRQHMDWERSVDWDRECYKCWECGERIDNRMFPLWFAGNWEDEDGTVGPYRDINMGWEPKYDGREVSGYWINQMMVPWKSCKRLIKEYRHAQKEGELNLFYNFKLGLPWQNTDTKVTGGLFYTNIVNKEVVELDSVMGVDVQGSELYVIIGNKEAIYGITKCVDEVNELGQIIKSKWDRLAELMEVYDVRVCVIDATYKPNDVLLFAKRFPKKVYMNWYQPSPKGGKIFRYADEVKFTQKRKAQELSEEIKVLTDRERAIDKLIAHLDGGVYRFNYDKTDPNFKELVKHSETMYARVIENKDGTQRREWANTGKNDYFHALVYFEVGMNKKVFAKD